MKVDSRWAGTAIDCNEGISNGRAMYCSTLTLEPFPGAPGDQKAPDPLGPSQQSRKVTFPDRNVLRQYNINIMQYVERTSIDSNASLAKKSLQFNCGVETKQNDNNVQLRIQCSQDWMKTPLMIDQIDQIYLSMRMYVAPFHPRSKIITSLFSALKDNWKEDYSLRGTGINIWTKSLIKSYATSIKLI